MLSVLPLSVGWAFPLRPVPAVVPRRTMRYATRSLDVSIQEVRDLRAVYPDRELFSSPLLRGENVPDQAFVEDDEVVLQRPYMTRSSQEATPSDAFVRAGPTRRVFFDGPESTAAIVNCGGLLRVSFPKWRPSQERACLGKLRNYLSADAGADMISARPSMPRAQHRNQGDHLLPAPTIRRAVRQGSAQRVRGVRPDRRDSRADHPIG